MKWWKSEYEVVIWGRLKWFKNKRKSMLKGQCDTIIIQCTASMLWSWEKGRWYCSFYYINHLNQYSCTIPLRYCVVINTHGIGNILKIILQLFITNHEGTWSFDSSFFGWCRSIGSDVNQTLLESNVYKSLRFTERIALLITKTFEKISIV